MRKSHEWDNKGNKIWIFKRENSCEYFQGIYSYADCIWKGWSWSCKINIYINAIQIISWAVETGSVITRIKSWIEDKEPELDEGTPRSIDVQKYISDGVRIIVENLSRDKNITKKL